MKKTFLFLSILKLQAKIYGSIFLFCFCLIFSCQKELKNTPSMPSTLSTLNANAGLDKIINFPTDSVKLDGKASSSNFKIVSYKWSQVSGPVNSIPIIVNPNSVQTEVRGLKIGSFNFVLMVADSSGKLATDSVFVTVREINVSTNKPPIAKAGPDQTINLPIQTVLLDGSASSDSDNNITNYLWSYISGSSTNISFDSVNNMVTHAFGLVAGVNKFELKVTDSGGLISRDTVQIVINPNTNSSHWSSLPYFPTFSSKIWMAGTDANNVFCGIFNQFFKFNQNYNWTSLAMPTNKVDYVVAFGLNGKLYMGGGLGWNDTVVTQNHEMYEYNPLANSWTQKNNAPFSGDGLAAMVINNKAYIIQGNYVWAYNQASDTYTRKNDFPSIPVSFPYTIPSNNFVLNGEGYAISQNDNEPNKIWKYLQETDTWQQKASLPQSDKVTCCFSSNNIGYVLTDSAQSRYNLNYPLHLWQYNVSQNSWQRIYDDYPGLLSAYNLVTYSTNGFAYVGFGNMDDDFTSREFLKFQ